MYWNWRVLKRATEVLFPRGCDNIEISQLLTGMLQAFFTGQLFEHMLEERDIRATETTFRTRSNFFQTTREFVRNNIFYGVLTEKKIWQFRLIIGVSIGHCRNLRNGNRIESNNRFNLILKPNLTGFYLLRICISNIFRDCHVFRKTHWARFANIMSGINLISGVSKSRSQ